MVAVGGLPTLIEIGVEIVVFTPSETESRAEYWPGCEYVWLGLAAVEVVLSPNVHEYVSGWPFGIRRAGAREVDGERRRPSGRDSPAPTAIGA